MNRIILQLFAVGLLFAIGQGLECYKCDVGLWSVCLTSKITCKEGEHCFSGVGEAAGFVNITKKGCLAVASCNKTNEVTFPNNNSTTVYSMTKTCCNTDLCNAAPGLPGASSVGLALATVTTLIMAQVMV